RGEQRQHLLLRGDRGQQRGLRPGVSRGLSHADRRADSADGAAEPGGGGGQRQRGFELDRACFQRRRGGELLQRLALDQQRQREPAQQRSQRHQLQRRQRAQRHHLLL